MLTVAEALARVLAKVGRVASEPVALVDADRRVLAEDVVAPRPLPGFDNSAMDGFAVRSADLPGELRVIGGAAAGAAFAGEVTAGTAVRIMTGAPMPRGADTVVILEDATAAADRVTLPAQAVGDNVRHRGEDLEAGAVAVAAGTRLGAGELGLLAALNLAEVVVARAPRVAIISTGDELVALGGAISGAQIIDSSSYALAAQIREAGGVPVPMGIARDDVAAMKRVLTAALAHDVVITIGGVSAGDRDVVRDALADAGLALDFWKVAMKPGKPLAFARSTRALVFGLPGNAVSSMVGFELFVRPALLAMQGAREVEARRLPVVVRGGYRKPLGRTHFLRATISVEDGRLVADLHPRQGSASLTSMVGVDALVEVAAEATELAAGGAATARWIARR